MGDQGRFALNFSPQTYLNFAEKFGSWKGLVIF